MIEKKNRDERGESAALVADDERSKLDRRRARLKRVMWKVAWMVIQFAFQELAKTLLGL